jgi:hypothetical protein
MKKITSAIIGLIEFLDERIGKEGASEDSGGLQDHALRTQFPLAVGHDFLAFQGGLHARVKRADGNLDS